MKKIAFLLVMLSLSGCSNFNEFINSRTFLSPAANPLKTQDDIDIEKFLVGGKWLYQRQDDDCKDTYWAQRFYKNKYYKSGGSSCLLTDTFSVDAENWHVKNKVLYIINLSPRDGEDIILKYGISAPEKNKLLLRRGLHTYTFTRESISGS